METVLEIKITRIGGLYHARLWEGTELRDEMACVLKEDIGYICREMMRWFDKGGGNVESSNCRKRMWRKGGHTAKGRIWYHRQLEEKKYERNQ